jgi:hypothetical protein
LPLRYRMRLVLTMGGVGTYIHMAILAGL